MPTEAAISKDHPLMKAWEAYKVTEEYANTLKWATHVQHLHTEGSLWAAFEQGWRAREESR